MSSPESLAQPSEWIAEEADQYLRVSETPLDVVLYIERTLAKFDEAKQDELRAQGVEGEPVRSKTRIGLDDSLANTRRWLIDQAHANSVYADPKFSKKSFTQLCGFIPDLTPGDVEREELRPLLSKRTPEEEMESGKLMGADEPFMSKAYKEIRPMEENKRASAEYREEVDAMQAEARANLSTLPELPNREQATMLLGVLQSREAQLRHLIEGRDETVVSESHAALVMMREENVAAIGWVEHTVLSSPVSGAAAKVESGHEGSASGEATPSQKAPLIPTMAALAVMRLF